MDDAHTHSQRARRRLLGRSAAAIVVALSFAAGIPSVASAADPSLKAAFGFDEASGAQLPDVSGNGNNGSVAGATWTDAGRFGSALNFDGIDDVVTVPDADSLDFSVGMTIEAWVRPTQLTGYRVAVIKEPSPGSLALTYAMYAQNGRYSVPAYQVNMENRIRGPFGTTQLPANTWSHVAGTYDGAVFRIYVNGIQVGSEGRRGLLTTSVGPLRIGGTLSYPEWFKGQIDEVRLYNRGLTAAEVQADMNTAVAGQIDTIPPTAPTPFTETSHGATTISTTWGASTDDRGVEGYHVYLNGTEVGTTTSTSFTFTGLSCSTTYQLGVEARDARPNASTRTLFSAATDDCDTTLPSVSLTAPAAAAQLAGTVSVSADASDNDAVAGVQFLLDGAALGSEDTTAPYSVPWNTRSVTNGLHVLKARARDRSGNERTSAEITVTVENATAPPVDGLVAGYGFDEDSGTTALDSSNLGNTGTISGATRTPNGRIGGALDFDGVNDIVNIADSSSLDLTSAMTLSAWVRPDVLNGSWRTLIFKERPGGVVYGLYAQEGNPLPLGQMTVGTSTDARVRGTSQLPLSTWTHLAYTYDGTQQRLWLDGQLVATSAQTGAMPQSTGALRIGANLIYGAERFDGLIDEVRVYNRALPQAEIEADMNTSVSEPDIDAPSTPVGLAATGSVGRVALSWQASTDNVGVTHYNVHRETTPGFTPDATNRIAQPTTTAYTDTGLAAGTYYYKVAAADRVNNVSDPTAAASGVVQADTQPPSVSITAPSDSATVAGAINVTANAADNDAVAGVQFMLNGQPLGAEDTSAPYSVSWNTRLSANGGPYVLTARARDGSANTHTSAAVTVQVNNTFAPPPGLVAGYGFDEGTGTTVGDAAGNGNDGTIRGATWVPVGRIGGALNFDGVDDWITVPDSNSLDIRTGMTISAWVRPDAIGTAWRTVIFKERTGNLVYGNYANAGNASVPNGEIATNGTINPTIKGTTKVPDATWTHLTVTYDGANLRLYVNGALVKTEPRTGLIDASTGPLRIAGNSTWGEFFDGLIDEVRVYDRPLAQDEVQNDMATGVSGDSNAPTVTAFTPAAGATGVPVATSVTATFSEAMAASTINSTTFVLRDPAGAAVPATVTYDDTNAKATLRTTSALHYGTQYTATLEGGSSGPRVTDMAGNALAADHTRSFTTEPTPPPILVVDSQANPRSTYVTEIMEAEGLNAFSTNDISLVDASYLSNFEVVVLGDVTVTTAQVTALTNWVNAGGNLIALSPDKKLAALLGSHRLRNDAVERISAREHRERAGRGDRRASPSSSTAPPTATRSPARPRSPRCTRPPAARPRAPRCRCGASVPTEARRRHSRSISARRPSRRARGTRPGPGRNATGSTRSAPTTSSTAPPSPTGSTSRRSTSRRRTSSSACSPT